VKDRQGMEQNVTGREAPFRHQHLSVRQEVVLAEHGALGATGGAGRVKNGRKIIAGAWYGLEIRSGLTRLVAQAAGSTRIERRKQSTVRGRHLPERAFFRRIPDQ